MKTIQPKAQCVLWFAKLESVAHMQRDFRRTYLSNSRDDKLPGGSVISKERLAALRNINLQDGLGSLRKPLTDNPE
jgi:hypothetical protein